MREKMRRRAKIRTNNSNCGKRALKRWWGENTRLNLSTFSFFSLLSPLFLSHYRSSLSLCLSLSVYQPFLIIKISLFSLPSNSPGLSWSLYFSYSLSSRHSLSIHLTESLSTLAWFSLHFCLSAAETKNRVYSLRFILRHGTKPYPKNA